MTLPAHLFVSSIDGCLYDTRVPCWSSQPALREPYCRTFQTMGTVAALKATLRNGEYAWPGLYQMYFIASDGEALSFDAVRDNLRQVIDAMQSMDNSGWRVIGTDINYEDTELRCAHTGKRIPAAYGDDCENEAEEQSKS